MSSNMVFRIASLACCRGATSAEKSDDRQMSFVSFGSLGSQDADAARGVLCQDGTISGVYYLEASQTKDADKWIIWFQGGGATTSSDWSTEAYPIDFHFGEEFATWNQIYFPTCSGDYRSGQRTTPLNGLYHQGHLHVVNGIAEMKKRIKTEMTKLLIGGCSVGGHSQIINVDYIADQMSADVEVRAWINSGLRFDVVVYPDFVAGKMVEHPASTRKSVEDLNAYVDESCRAALGEDWYKCTSFDHVFPFISTPSFVSQAKYDKVQLEESSKAPSSSFPDDTSTWSKEINNYTAYYGEAMRKVFVEAVQGNEDAALFLPSCFDHCSATTVDAPETVTTVTGQSYTAKEAFLAWYHNKQTERIYLDACTDGMPCNPAADPDRHFSCASAIPPSDCKDARSRVCGTASGPECKQCIKAHWNEFEPFCTPDQVRTVCDSVMV